MSADFTHVPDWALVLIFGALVCWCCVTKVLTTIYLALVPQTVLGVGWGLLKAAPLWAANFALRRDWGQGTGKHSLPKTSTCA